MMLKRLENRWWNPPMVKNMIDGWLGKATQEEPVVLEKEPENNIEATKIEEQKAKIKDLQTRAKNLSKEG